MFFIDTQIYILIWFQLYIYIFIFKLYIILIYGRLYGYTFKNYYIYIYRLVVMSSPCLFPRNYDLFISESKLYLFSSQQCLSVSCPRKGSVHAVICMPVCGQHDYVCYCVAPPRALLQPFGIKCSVYRKAADVGQACRW